jgi:putative membrane protein
MADLYLWIKALHVISVIAWMAGMLYLPRLFVYHVDAPKGSQQSETFKIMERRLLKAIINPAMIATWVFGVAMVVMVDLWNQPWLWAKVVLVLGMQVMHGLFSRWQRDFANDANTRPAKTYRIANEVPTLLMIGIVILVIVKPF